MNNIDIASRAGGLLSLLVLIHLVADWVFQSHQEAMSKHKDIDVRSRHCLIYTAFFIPWMWFFNFNWWQFFIGLNVLFYSHLIEDTYIPVYLWARYIRRPPEMNTDPAKGFVHDPKIGFKKFVETSLGKILMIVNDQIVHVLFLLVIVVLTMMKR